MSKNAHAVHKKHGQVFNVVVVVSCREMIWAEQEADFAKIVEVQMQISTVV